MTSERRKTIQLILLAAMVIAAIRVGVIFYERHSEGGVQERPKEQALDADYYVTPKKLHAYDLTSARELTKTPVWIREGYKFVYYPYAHSAKRVDFERPAGLLGPLERLEITDVIQQPTPGEKGTKQVLAVFGKDGKTFGFPIGVEKGGDYQIFADEILFLENPRDLYKHWPSEVWDAIDRHEVKPGMSELQASFAAGVSVLKGSDGNQRVLEYPNGGNRLQVTFQNGRAVEVKSGQKAGST